VTRPVSSSPAGSSDGNHASPALAGGAGGATPPTPPPAPAGSEPGTGAPASLGSHATRLPGPLGGEELTDLGRHGGVPSGSPTHGWAAGGLLSPFLHPGTGPAGAAAIISLAAAADAGTISGGGSSNAPPPPLPASGAGSGSSGGFGVAFSTLFALLVSLAAFSAQQFSRRLILALPPWRPAAFIAVIERPG
jgi:hypothetical protein